MAIFVPKTVKFGKSFIMSFVITKTILTVFETRCMWNWLISLFR